MIRYPEVVEVLRKCRGVELLRVSYSIKYQCTHGKYRGKHIIKSLVEYKVLDNTTGLERTYELKRNAVKYYEEKIKI